MIPSNNIGPYKYQRDRQLGNKQPRPAQPSIQPNRKPRPQGWGMSSSDYYQEVFSEYLRQRQGF